MKFSLLIILTSAFLLGACGKSEEEKFYEKMNQDLKNAEIRKERDRCIRQNRINDTNIDCHKKYPIQ